MDLKICGILDIVLILGLIISLILGYKKGFVKKVVSVVGVLAVLVFSVVYCAQFANWLIDRNIIAPSIYNKVYASSQTAISEKLQGKEVTVYNVLTIGLNIPSFFANFINRSLDTTNVDVAAAVAQGATKVTMIGISFLILSIGIFLIVLIIKIIATVLRKNALIRFVDGSLGALLYAAIYMIIVLAVFALISIFWDKEWFLTARTWLETDMGVKYNAAGEIEKFHFIGLTRWVFYGNFLVNIFHLFF